MLALLAEGRRNRDIAESLFLSERTVHHHIQHIYQKLGISTRAAATLFSMHHNLLGVDTSGA